jgi:hypothetical protein
MREGVMAVAFVGATLLAGAAISAATSPAPAKLEDASLDPAVLEMREAAWRAWFGGDTEALGTMLPADFVGISMEDGAFSGREQTLEQSRAFHAAGGRLMRLEFPETRPQIYGDVVVLYGRYVAAFESGGAQHTVRGRLTEMFARRGRGWVHTGWHLDTVAPAPTP